MTAHGHHQESKRIAFLFLTVGEHNHAKQWARFFQVASPMAYSIYNHSKHAVRPESWLAPYVIADKVETKWAHISLVVATVMLLKAALADESNQYFVLCSESCIPIIDFATLHTYLFQNAPFSFFCFNPEYHRTTDSEQRYMRFKDKDFIAKKDFMKADQWWILHRKAAEQCVRDEHRIWAFDRVFASDEHFFINMVNQANLPFRNRWSTYVDFEVERSHPIVFHTLSLRFLESLRQRGFFFLRKVHPKCKWIN